MLVLAMRANKAKEASLNKQPSEAKVAAALSRPALDLFDLALDLSFKGYYA